MNDEPEKVKKKAHFAIGPFVLTLLLTVMVGWVLYQAFMSVIPEQNMRVVDILVGNVIGIWSTSVAYWFGTTFGSAAKNEIIAKAPPVS